MSIRGSAYSRFKRALETGNLLVVTTAAMELPTVSLADALAIVTLMAEQADDRYPRAAARWAGRLALESPRLTVEELQMTCETLGRMRRDPAGGQPLQALCERHGLPDVAAVLRTHGP